MRINPLLMASLILVSVLFVPLVSAYHFRSIMKDDGSSNNIAYPPSFFWPGGSCTVGLNLYASATSASYPYSLSNSWYSPDGVTILTSTPTYNTNINCLYQQGAPITTTESNHSFYDAKTTTTSSATVDTWAIADYECEADSQDRIIYVSNSTTLDSNNFYPYSYSKNFRNTCGLPPVCTAYTPSSTEVQVIVNDIIRGYNPTCGLSLRRDYYGADSLTCAFGNNWALDHWIYLPFTSTFTGTINLSVSNVGWDVSGGSMSIGSTTRFIGIYDTVLNTTTSIATTIPFSVNDYIVQRNRTYLLIIGECNQGGIPAGNPTRKYTYTIYNLSLSAYEPLLNCTTYTPCQNGTQFRTCYDLNNVITPFIEQQSCFSFPTEYIFLGMDAGYEANSWYCSEGVYNLITGLCSRDPNIRPRRIPNGWYRNGQYVTDITARSGWVQDYVDVDLADYYAPDQSTSEGSLKLWFIPRKPFVPVYNGTGTGQVVCMNTTEGQVGGMQYYVNDTLWISRNITALSPYMSISYRAKKCPMTVQQTAYYTPCSIPCQFFGTCQNSGLCANTTAIPGTSSSAFGDDYYTGDGCPQIPSPATLGVEIENIDTGQLVQSYLKTVTATNWLLGYQEDNINNMNISAVYKLSFSAYPAGGITTNDGNCVMIDDVNVNFRSDAVRCNSECSAALDFDGDGINDYTYIEATPLSASSCTIRTLSFDPRCCPAGISDDCGSLQTGAINQTCSGTTLVTRNMVTGEYIVIPNNPTCTAQAQAANFTVGVNPFIASLLGDTGTAQMVASGFGVFLTTIFIAMIINLLIAGYLAYKVGHWEAGAITLIPLVIIETIPPLNIFPFWFSLVFIIFLGLFVGEFAVKRARGGR